MEIDPWASKGIKNYDEICEKFGLDKIDSTKLPNPTHLHKRGIIFAHRIFCLIDKIILLLMNKLFFT